MRLPIILLMLSFMVACSEDSPNDTPAPPGPTEAAPPQPASSLTVPLPDNAIHPHPDFDPTVVPTLKLLKLPNIKGARAIWGSTGRDVDGNIYFGISVAETGSAVLLRFNPDDGTFTNCGAVLSALKDAGLDKPGQSQAKIHSRIVQASDGYMYFASMDEQGEKGDGSQNPTWGGHLWRMDPKTLKWDHLLATEEALIAITCGDGRHVFALGYFGHVVHVYDTKTGKTRSRKIGALDGHVSRNIFSDRRGHVYVPKQLRLPGDIPLNTLEELTPTLQVVHSSELEGYGNAQSHGFVGVTATVLGPVVTISQGGMIHQTSPTGVIEKGRVDPQGYRYVGGLFSPDGERYLVGFTTQYHRKAAFEYVVFDLETGETIATRIRLPYEDDRIQYKHLLYGSITFDDAGRAYVVGTDQNTGKPVVLQVAFD